MTESRAQPLALQRDYSLSTHNSLAVNASAAYFVSADNAAQVEAAVGFADEKKLPLLVLGGGSNLILASDFPGLVLHLDNHGIELLANTADGGSDHVQLRVAAGENWNALVEYCLSQGYYGIENLISIPGNVGAAPIQNIGAYGVELSDVLLAVEGFDIADRQWRRLSAEECQLAYRDSIFKRELRDRFVITHVELGLSKVATPMLSYAALTEALASDDASIGPAQVAETIASLRAAKLPDPRALPNAGSFFKNPVVDAVCFERLLSANPAMPHWPVSDSDTQWRAYKLAAAWLIDQCGWKGQGAHGCRMHDKQALVLTNPNACDGSAVLALADDVAASVLERFGIALEIEPRIYPVTADA